jgi:alkylhydroperoxidase family enzyme
LVEKDQAPLEVKERFEKIESAGARVLNLYKAVAHSPDVLRNLMRLGNSLLARAELEPKLRELAILRVAKLCGSEYEWTQHVPIALEMGVTQEQVEAISNWKASVAFSDIERAVLEYTDEVAENVRVKDETFTTLQKYLSEQSLVELTLSIGYWGMVARVLVPLQVEIEAQSIGSTKDLLGKR